MTIRGSASVIGGAEVESHDNSQRLGISLPRGKARREDPRREIECDM